MADNNNNQQQQQQQQQRPNPWIGVVKKTDSQRRASARVLERLMEQGRELRVQQVFDGIFQPAKQVEFRPEPIPDWMMEMQKDRDRALQSTFQMHHQSLYETMAHRRSMQPQGLEYTHRVWDVKH